MKEDLLAKQNFTSINTVVLNRKQVRLLATKGRLSYNVRSLLDSKDVMCKSKELQRYLFNYRCGGTMKVHSERTRKYGSEYTTFSPFFEKKIMLRSLSC